MPLEPALPSHPHARSGARLAGLVLATSCCLLLAPRAAADHEVDLLLAPLDAALLALDLFVLAPQTAWHPEYARVDCDVSPEEAEVYLDGRYVGTADELDGLPNYLWVRPGRHTITFEHPGHETLRIRFRARAGREVAIDESLPRRERPRYRDDYERRPRERYRDDRRDERDGWSDDRWDEEECDEEDEDCGEDDEMDDRRRWSDEED